MNVTFDGVNKLIEAGQGVTTLDIQIDIYSAWKQWLQIGSNSKFLPALRTIGGDPTVGEKTVAPYFFLMNGWKIKPYSWNHTLNLVGNLFVDDPEIYGSNIVIPCNGNYTVLVNMVTTSDASKLEVGSGVTEQDKTDIRDKILTDGVKFAGADIMSIKGSVEYELPMQIEIMQGVVDHIDELEVGRWKISNNQLIMYKSDGQTVLKRFNLLNKAGQPSETEVYERVPT